MFLEGVYDQSVYSRRIGRQSWYHNVIYILDSFTWILTCQFSFSLDINIELPTLACSLKESTISLSTLEGLDGSLGTTMLFILLFYLDYDVLIQSQSRYKQWVTYPGMFLEGVYNESVYSRRIGWQSWYHNVIYTRDSFTRILTC
jgi:hypothetical protein